MARRGGCRRPAPRLLLGRPDPGEKGWLLGSPESAGPGVSRRVSGVRESGPWLDPVVWVVEGVCQLLLFESSATENPGRRKTILKLCENSFNFEN